jgi:hypothetical protein
MPLRQRRVPDEFLQVVFERLNRSGELAVLVAHLQDRADDVDDTIRLKFIAEIVTDPKAAAEVQRLQGALAELHRLAATYETLGTRDRAAKGDPEGLTSRPPAPPRRKRDRSRS